MKIKAKGTLCIRSPLQRELLSPRFCIDAAYAFASDRGVRLGTWSCRNRNVLVNLLSLVVILRMKLPVRPGDELGCLVGLEAFVQSLLARRQLRIAQPLIAQHQSVVSLQVFGVDLEHLLKLLDGCAVLSLEEQYP